MRKLILVLTLLTVFFVGTSMKTSETIETPPPCWLEYSISWDGNCVYPDDNTIYYANLTIIDVCDNNNPVFSETQVIETTEDHADFCIVDALCTLDEHAVCYKVVCTVQKRNKTTQAIVCSGQEIGTTKNCAGILALYGDTKTVTLN